MLYLILFFAIAFILFSVSLWKLTIWDDEKVIVDFWIAMIEFFGFIWVLYEWSQLLFTEIEWKTIFLLLSKPIRRFEFIVWKFLWFSFVLLLILLSQVLVFLGILLFKAIPITLMILLSFVFIYLKFVILLALVIFLSTFMSNIITILVAIMVYFVSHSFNVILDLVYRTKSIYFIYLSRWLQIVFPPFEAINLKDFIWSWVIFSTWYHLWNLAYCLIYLSIVLIFSVLIFERKKFE